MQGCFKGLSHILKIAIMEMPVQGDCMYILTPRATSRGVCYVLSILSKYVYVWKILKSQGWNLDFWYYDANGQIAFDTTPPPPPPKKKKEKKEKKKRKKKNHLALEYFDEFYRRPNNEFHLSNML